MKNMNIKHELNKIHKNAKDIREDIIKNIEHKPDNSLVIIRMVDITNQLLTKTEVMSHINIDVELGSITFSNFKDSNNINDKVLAIDVIKALDIIDKYELFDISIELYNRSGLLISGDHVTKVYTDDDTKCIVLSDENDKNLKF